jgi:hypothetical protein
MELSTVFNNSEMQIINNNEPAQSSSNGFIVSNTVIVNEYDLRDHHIIPVWLKDNEPLISQADFVNATQEITHQLFKDETILKPSIRVSHPIKGRVPSAKLKAANDLSDDEKTLYYERMMFLIEIPSIMDDINGNNISLMVGGVKAYNLDNLYNRKGSLEHFKVFIGFKNQVCTNLCVSTDGFKSDLKVRNVAELMEGIYKMIVDFNISNQLKVMKRFVDYHLTENQFAQFLGRARLYQFLPNDFKKEIMLLNYSDTQLTAVARDYYNDLSFKKSSDGSISLWNFYNLFTGANKSSYIDTFLNRSVNAFDITNEMSFALANKSPNWFLS